MEKLVDIVHFLHLDINKAFGSADSRDPFIQTIGNRQRLGPAGLSLHYANIVLQMDTLVARSASMPANTRDALYQSLPPNIKLTLRFDPTVNTGPARTAGLPQLLPVFRKVLLECIQLHHHNNKLTTFFCRDVSSTGYRPGTTIGYK
ncbi:hypothetical protein KIW84_014260 [Lathyrus oleraceus]|uniref:DUF668 domain-containing protein n=1 Tax=Pisum sativum TaxID=3888 RepID=A0A9D5BMQ1_PEA|nr:hypothetical protein KIW84_014260 [Pisum sativum]